MDRTSFAKAFFWACGKKPYQYQVDFIEKIYNSSRVVVVKSRRIGITYAAAVFSFIMAVNFGKKILSVFPSLRQTIKFIEYVQSFWHQVNLKTNFKKGFEIRNTKTEIAFSNGGEIVALPNNPECYDEKTEILTTDGWKYFKDLNKNDEVAQVNKDTFQLSFVKPIKIVKKKYTGVMVSLKTKTFDFCVTPNHRMLLFQLNKKNRKIRSQCVENAFEISHYEQYMATGADWIGKEIDYFEPPKPKGKNFNGLRFSGDDFCAFMGIWIAEGRISIRKGLSYEIIIFQYNENIRKEIEELLERIGCKFTKEKRGFKIYNRNMVFYLKQFGRSHEKFVPQIIKNSSKRQIRIFLDWYFKGDGSKKNGRWHCTTVSRKLADDIQEMEIKLGVGVTIKTTQPRSRHFKSGITSFARVAYTIWEGRKNILEFNRFKWFRTKDLKILPYDGNVYCVEVPEKFILVRRNGMPLISGNTIRGFGADWIFIDEVAHFPNINDIWNSVLPSITRGGSIALISTPRGASGLFYEKSNDENYERIDIPWDVCPDFDNKIIEDIKKDLTIDIFEQEYNCAFLESADSYFPYGLTMPCIGDVELNSSDTSGSFSLGIDIGRKRDLTAIMGIEKRNNKFVLVYSSVLREVKYEEQLNIISKIIEEKAPKQVFIDQTGIGAMMAEILVKKYGSGRITPITFNKDNKNDMMVYLRKNFEDRTLIIPNDDMLINSLQSIKREQTAMGIKYDVDRNDAIGHADEAIALALALYSFKKSFEPKHLELDLNKVI